MCIRDRQHRVQIGRAKDLGDLGRITEVRRRREQRVVHAKNCLLYTSDAADERSSVDLGGRRIIKKKHNA